MTAATAPPNSTRITAYCHGRAESKVVANIKEWDGTAQELNWEAFEVDRKRIEGPKGPFGSSNGTYAGTPGKPPEDRDLKEAFVGVFPAVNAKGPFLKLKFY